MKKLAIGCGLVVLVCGLAAIGGAYYLYWQVRSTVEQFAELGQIPEIERSIRVRDSFVPPANEELTRAQLERLVAVQTRVRQRLGERFKEFETKYKALSEKENTNLSDLPGIVAAYRDITAAWLDAKRSQVEALNDAGLSLEEYRWIRQQAYRALGMPFLDFDVGRFAEDLQSGNPPADPARILGAIEAAGPEANRKLIEAFRTHLEEHLALASFGL